MADPQQQQTAQAVISALVLRDLAQAWPNLDPANLKATLPRYTQLVYALIHKYAPLSGALAGRFYQQARRDAGLLSGSVRVADLPPPEQVATAVQWATTGLWADPTAIEPAQTKIDGAVAKLVQDVGRTTITGTVQADDAAKGWARITEPAPCAFCALLATRGAVYKTRQTAAFKAHDHCRCHPEPIFTAYEPSAQVRDWQAQYAEATRGVRGSRNQRNAWRQAFEGRTTN